MLRTLWRMLGQSALCGTALLAGASLVHAQGGIAFPSTPATPQLIVETPKTATLGTPSETAEMKARIDRLERQNQELMDALRGLQKTPAPTSTAIDANQGGLSANDVRNIINGYFAEKDAKAKEEARTKKDAWYEVGSDPSMSGRWTLNRMTLESPQKDFRAHLGGRFQFDNYYIGAPQRFITTGATGAFDDNNFFRRIRVEFDGQAFENFEWNFEIDLERNSLNEKDQAGTLIANGNFPPTRFDELWVGMRNLPFIGNIRVGNVRPPMGLECYTSSRNLLFLERSSGFEAFLQEFAPGVWIFNDAFDQRMTWAATVDRPNFSVQKGGEYGKGDIAVTARIAGLPIYENEGRCLVHLGGSWQFRSDPWNTTIKDRTYSYSAPPDWRASFFTPTFVNTGTFISDHSNQVGLEFLAIFGPLRVQAEWFGVQASDVIFPAAKGARVATANFTSGYVAAAYVLTGENHRYDKRLGRIDRFVPNESFFWVRGEDGSRQFGKGAWEIAARWDWIDLDDDAIRGGYMNNYTLGINWYLNPNLRCQLNWTITDLTRAAAAVGGGASGPNGITHGVGLRVQWEF